MCGTSGLYFLALAECQCLDSMTAGLQYLTAAPLTVIADCLQVSDAASAASVTSTASPEAVMVGRCYEHRCNDSRKLFVRVPHSSQWIFCPSHESVMVVNISVSF